MKRSTWNEVRAECNRHDAPLSKAIFGIPRGGVPIALLLERERGCVIVDEPQKASVLVDDVRDSGGTANRWSEKYSLPVWCAFEKETYSEWLEMPWERYEESSGAAEAVTRFLQALELPIANQMGVGGMKDTPDRFVRAMGELTSGYGDNPTEILERRFPVSYDEMIAVRDIHFWSLCEHHLLPFHGTVTVGYVPGEGGVVGLSKLARLVHCFSRRFQIQERLTAEIASTMENELKPMGCGVVIRATHLCMAMRGIRSPAEMVTSDLRGVMRDATPRAEFLALTRGG
jgi:GTP cyclohydrolase I